jgi:hypothetical protein
MEPGNHQIQNLVRERNAPDFLEAVLLLSGDADPELEIDHYAPGLAATFSELVHSEIAC